MNNRPEVSYFNSLEGDVKVMAVDLAGHTLAYVELHPNNTYQVILFTTWNSTYRTNIRKTRRGAQSLLNSHLASEGAQETPVPMSDSAWQRMIAGDRLQLSFVKDVVVGDTVNYGSPLWQEVTATEVVTVIEEEHPVTYTKLHFGKASIMASADGILTLA